MKREVDNYHCGNCVYFKVNADRDESICKKIDHKTVQFSTPWFKSYDCNQYNGIVCSDFIPSVSCVDAKKNWTDFEEYWENFVEQWLPYQDTNVTIGFFINGNKNISYKVKLMDFVMGTMFDGNKLKAIEKVYYKRNNNKNGFNYKLIREEIDGIIIKK